MIIFCSKPICHVGVRKKGHCTIMHFLGLIARAGWEIRENVEGRVVGVSLPALVTALLHNRRIARRHRKPLYSIALVFGFRQNKTLPAAHCTR